MPNFLVGASSIGTLRQLHEDGFALFGLDALHAKIVIAPPDFVSIGSQNLTLRGTKNKEATVAMVDEVAVQEALTGVQPWLAARVAITEQMIASVEEFVQEHTALQEKLLADAQEVEDKILRQALQASVIRKVRRVNDSIASLGDSLDQLPWPLIRDVVRNSVWWFDHPSGRPVRAPGFANHVAEDYHEGYVLDFGSNTFLVSRAVWECLGVVEASLGAATNGTMWSLARLKAGMRNVLQVCVTHVSGYEYERYPLFESTHDLKFGTHSIDTDDFIDYLLNYVGVLEAFYGG